MKNCFKKMSGSLSHASPRLRRAKATTCWGKLIDPSKQGSHKDEPLFGLILLEAYCTKRQGNKSPDHNGRYDHNVVQNRRED